MKNGIGHKSLNADYSERSHNDARYGVADLLTSPLGEHLVGSTRGIALSLAYGSGNCDFDLSTRSIDTFGLDAQYPP